MIDLHCHALPGIDDGPDTMEGAIALARASQELGTRTVVATPHIDHAWNVDPATLPDRVAELNAALVAADIDLEVLTGGEVALTRLADLDEIARDAVALGGGRYLLLEAPLTPGAGDFEAIVLATLRERPVLLAHPERCPAFLRAPERLLALLGAGVLTQVTAGSLIGQFGSTIQQTTIRWIRRGWVHVVASDSHDAYRRPPGLGEPIERAGLRPLTHWLTDAVPRAILDGTPVPPRPEADAGVERGGLRPRA